MAQGRVPSPIFDNIFKLNNACYVQFEYFFTYKINICFKGWQILFLQSNSVS